MVEPIQPPQHALAIELAGRTLSLADQQFQERRFLLRGLRREELFVGLRPELDVVVRKRGLLAGVPRVLALGIVVDKTELKSNFVHDGLLPISWSRDNGSHWCGCSV